MMDETEKKKKTEEYALKLISLARDTIIVNMRFLDVALNRLKVKKKDHLNGTATDGEYYFYDPAHILRLYSRSKELVARSYLHTLMHCIFSHDFGYDRFDDASLAANDNGMGGDYGVGGKDVWDLSCDIAVENLIMELDLPAVKLPDDDVRQMKLKGIKRDVKRLTAEKIYRYFLVNPLSRVDREKYAELFCHDRHVYWQKAENYELSDAAWKKISERIKADIGTFSKNAGHSESLIDNLSDATREKYDYKSLLSRFCTAGEELTVNDEEFDYIYYTYGLNTYGNMPLVEPLEFKDVKKIKDFAIVLDTSASCRGDIVRSFLKTTYGILKDRDSFFDQINVHIIQCDNEVKQDTKIENRAEFDRFIKDGKLMGYGGTDFRPAFEYVDKLIEERKFDNFKGMIYFTDGYGIYPEKAPDYDCMFVFARGDLSDNADPDEAYSDITSGQTVPWWVIPVILDRI
ncbi:MAG: VWA-like domain-containing protein [Lachnospiraceae bacterium]|nr:VWA-like domain-containing protein [Lachnospiraceae bacterium]